MKPIKKTASILLIDNDEFLADVLITYLENEGFAITWIQDGENGLKKGLNQHFDAIILEIELPKMNGLEILKNIRAHLDTPILILTSRANDLDQLVSLEIGADDYLLKPCNPYELLSRLRAILRRTQYLPIHKSIIEFGHIKLHCRERVAILHDEILDLTNAEFNILEMLMKSPGQAFSKEELTEYALGRKYTAYDRSIDVHISNIRNKIGPYNQQEEWIKTVRGFGYLFRDTA